MKNMTRWFVVGALAATGVLAFACGGGNSEGGGGGTTPSATAPATSAAPSASTAMTATATATATTPPTPAAPPLTVMAFKMTDAKSKKTVEVKDDGSVMAEGKVVAKFVGAELQDKDGKSLMGVAADGSVTAMGQTKPAKFNDKDELLVGGGTIFIGDDGVLKLVGPDGKPDKDSGKIKLTGFKPQARRAATVFVMAMFMASPDPKSTTPTVASAAPATASAKPASTAKK